MANMMQHLHPNLPNPFAPSQMPAGVSTGRLIVGIATTAMGALSAVQHGTPVPLVITDIFAPIVTR
jgi:hypothetical protein